jgi:hypothetical protein
MPLPDPLHRSNGVTRSSETTGRLVATPVLRCLGTGCPFFSFIGGIALADNPPIE